MKIDRKRTSVIIIKNGQLLGFDAEDPASLRRYFFLPGGLIENHESPAETAVRETKEETGYDIEILDGVEVRGMYDFDWNGRTYASETYFLAGHLTSEVHALVDDASYHRGVRWIKLSDVENEFSYHRDILEAVQHVIAEMSLGTEP